MKGIPWRVLQKIQTFFFAKREKSVNRKIGVTERPRSLNPRKVIAMAICPIIVHFTP